MVLTGGGGKEVAMIEGDINCQTAGIGSQLTWKEEGTNR